MLPLCLDQGIGVIPWSPLARGRLTRDWDEPTDRQGKDEVLKSLYTTMESADREVAQRVTQIAERRGVPRAQVALAWLLAKPAVTAPIVGATNPHHLDDAVAAVDLALTAEEMTELEDGYVPHPIEGFS